MKTEKMSFKNIKDVLSRDEMKMIMAGSSGSACGGCQSPYNPGVWAYCATSGNSCVCTAQVGVACRS